MASRRGKSPAAGGDLPPTDEQVEDAKTRFQRYKSYAANAFKETFGAAGKDLEEFASDYDKTLKRLGQSFVSNFADPVLAQGKVSLGQQLQGVRVFEEATASTAVAGVRNLESYRSAVEQVGIRIGEQPSKVQAWAESFSRLTGDFKTAEQGLQGIAGLAADTGRGIQEYVHFAAELRNVAGVAGDTTHAIGSIVAQAEKLGTAGGPAAFVATIEGASGILSQFAVKGEQDLLKFTAASAQLSSGYKDPGAGSRITQGAFGLLAADPVRFGRFLGRDITDEFGHVEDPTGTLAETVDKVKRRYGKRAKRVLQLNFNPEVGAALARQEVERDEQGHYSFKGVKDLKDISPSLSPQQSLETLKGTDAGQRRQAEAQLEVSSRQLLGSSTLLGSAADKLQQAAARFPVSASVASSAGGVATGAIGSAVGAAIAGKVAAGGGTKAAAGIVPAALGVVGKGASGIGLKAAGTSAVAAGGAILAAGAVGGLIGYGLDQKFGLSDELSGTGVAAGAIRDEANAEFAAGAGARRQTQTTLQSLQAARRQGPAELTSANLAAQTIVQRQGVQALSGPGAVAAILAELRREGKSTEGQEKFARMVVDGLKQVRFQVLNASGGPVQVAAEGAASSAAGSQSGG